MSGGTAEVTLITDASIGVAAQVMPSGATGIVRPAVGNPRDLIMEFVEGGRVTENTTVATSGFKIEQGQSLFPRGIPIGRVSDVNLDEVEIYQRVHLEPYADLKSIDIVQVLTRRPARLPDRRGGRAVILSAGAILRVGLLLLLAVVLQLSGLSQLGILGGHIDLVVLAVAAVAYYGGSVAGCATGFAAGFLLDLASGATMGVSSLVLTAVGYGVGRFREIRDPSHGLLPMAVGAAATGGFVIAFAAVSFMLDVGASVSPLVIRDAIVTTLLNTLLALPVFTGARKLLRPVLKVDPLEVRRRRRPPRETGPLGLRGLEV